MNTELENTPTESNDKDERTWAMLTHLLGLAGLLVPLGNIIGPLIIWAIKKDEFPLVDDQGKESLNFQITVTIGYVICIILMFVLIGIFLIIPLAIYSLVMIIIASIKANDGEAYRYPLTIRFIK